MGEKERMDGKGEKKGGRGDRERGVREEIKVGGEDRGKWRVGTESPQKCMCIY